MQLAWKTRGSWPLAAPSARRRRSIRCSIETSPGGTRTTDQAGARTSRRGAAETLRGPARLAASLSATSRIAAGDRSLPLA